MAKNEESIFKINKNGDFVTIDNRLFSDQNLSWKAKGILGYLLSKPKTWQVKVKDVINQSTDGKGSVTSGLDELERSNYIHKEKRRNQKGHFKGWNYNVFERPEMNTLSPTCECPKLESPKSDNPISDKPKSENQTYTNKDYTNTDRTNKRINKKRTTTNNSISSKITQEMRKIIQAWNDTFEIVVDDSDPKLLKAIAKATQTFELSELLQAIEYRSHAEYYIKVKPGLRDNPRSFFPYEETIKSDMKRSPYKLITVDKKQDLETKHFTRGADNNQLRFEKDPDKTDSQGRPMWREYD